MKKGDAMTETKAGNNILFKLLPVMLAFFAMGFVDLVGIATNYVKKDFGLSDTTANLFASMVFFWFLVGSVPTGMVMGKIGRRKTVVAGLAVTLAALALPTVDYGLTVVLASFCLLGIGNTILQVSLNPLIAGLIRPEKLSSALTFGQFVKAIASFIAPVLAAWEREDGSCFFRFSPLKRPSPCCGWPFRKSPRRKRPNARPRSRNAFLC